MLRTDAGNQDRGLDQNGDLAASKERARRKAFLSGGVSLGNRYLFTGIGLVLCYSVVAIMFDGFSLPFGVDYSVAAGTKASFGLDPRLGRDFHPFLILSALSKAAFLLPAAICLAVFFSYSLSKKSVAAAEEVFAKTGTVKVLIAVTVIVGVLVLFWSHIVLRCQPVYDDEYTYTFQAATIGGGNLVAKTPPCPECFRNVFIILRNDVWVGKYTSGHPLLLALSQLAGSPYLVTILLAALIPLLAFHIVRELYDRRTAIVVALLFTVSPFFLFTTATLMNHGTCLFFLLVFALCYLRSEKARSWLYPVMAGLALGVAFNIRPQCAVGFGAPFAVWSVVRIARSPRRSHALRHVAIGVAFAIPLAYALYYNHLVTGHYLTFPFIEAEPKGGSKVPFLSVTSQTDPGYTLLKGLYFSLINFWRMNTYLFGWGVSLLFVLLLIWRGKFIRVDAIWAGVIVSTVVVYLWFPSPGVLEIGPRYYFNMLLPFLIWTARGMIHLHDSLVESARSRNFRPQVLVPSFVFLSVLFSFFTFYREQMNHYQRLSEQAARPYEVVEAANIHNAIVVVRNLPPSGWVFGLRNNDPVLERNDVIYVWGTKPEGILCLLDRFPDRRVYGLLFARKGGAHHPGIVPFTREMLEQAADFR